MGLYLQQECRQVSQSHRHSLDTQKIKDMEKKVNKMQSAIQAHSKCKGERMEEKEAHLIELSALQRDVDEVRSKNKEEKNSLDRDIENLTEQKQALKSDNENLRDKLATFQVESCRLLRDLDIRLGASQEALAASEVQSARLQQQHEEGLAAAQERVAALRAESAELQGRLVASQERLTASQAESAELQERLVVALAELLKHSQREPESVDIAPWNVPRNDIHMSLEEIGRGGWGVVLRGTYEGEAVAVKQPHRDLLNQRLLDRLKRETRLMIQISHPNLVRIIAVVFDEAAERLRRPPLIVTELLDMNLRHCYQQRRLQPHSRVPVFLDVARGLHYMHDRQEPIIHRDVSAPNILLKALPDGRWRAKVSDFGSANLARLSVTAGEGAIIYTAPEAFPPQSPDAPRPQHTTKIDVYSFGILMCEVVTGEQPDPDLYQERLGQVQRLSGPLHSLIMRCTDHNPIRRPAMANVIQELNGISLP